MVKVVFFGTPEFAVPSLKKLIEDKDIEVIALVTQPDKAVGRKQIITAPPTKVLAKEHEIPVFQPEKLNRHPERSSRHPDPEQSEGEGSQEHTRDPSSTLSPQDDVSMAQIISNLNPDFIITCAYGQILKQNILDIAPVVNVHASLLPEYRGPAPINWMLINGDKEVGVTTMLSDAGVDTGDILLKSSIEISNEIKADKLTIKLSELGSELLIKTLKEFDQIKPLQQSPAENPEKQLGPFMDKQLGKINFQAESFTLGSANPRQSDFKVIKKNTAENIYNLYRGTYPWPGAYFMKGEQKIIILDCHPKLNNCHPKLNNCHPELNNCHPELNNCHPELNNCHPEQREGSQVSSRDPSSTPSPQDDVLIYKAGQISNINKEEESFSVQTQKGELTLKKLKAQGKSELSALSWLNGARLKLGDYLEN